jgi:hypothetical protein
VLVAALMAATADDGGGVGMPTIDIAQFLQFGLLGVIFVCVVTKKFIVPEWILKQMQDQYDAEARLKDEQIASLKTDKAELKEDLEQLQTIYRTDVIPALVRATQLNAEYMDHKARGEQNAQS